MNIKKKLDEIVRTELGKDGLANESEAHAKAVILVMASADLIGLSGCDEAATILEEIAQYLAQSVKTEDVKKYELDEVL